MDDRPKVQEDTSETYPEIAATGRRKRRWAAPKCILIPLPGLTQGGINFGPEELVRTS
ncbi:hypothetical protein EDC64_10366 [Aquabacter spiritensis]|uniref:Uncharacterized protein n=1 Tax=Aquabacter spiritensis TaxID=933073 RepID=A0A4R3M451_9HYPH|nr:hypothetical protein EDC64_10366 [Aquabacter spiritensis]